MTTYKLYRQHNCSRNHRKWETVAKCVWPRAYWIHGDGRFAVLAWCRVLTITLHEFPEPAEESKAFIDRYGCGGRCTGNHQIIELAPSLLGGSG